MDNENKAKSLSKYSVAVVFASVTMILIKIVGFLRDVILVQKVGQNDIQAGYLLGYSIPDLFYALLIGGALSAAITPHLSAAIERNDEKRAWKSASIFFTLASLVILVIALSSPLFIDGLLKLLYGGENTSELMLNTASAVGRIVFFQTFFFVVIGCLTSVLSAYKNFIAANVGALVYNVGGLAAMILFADKSVEAVKDIAYGIVLSSFLYMLVLLFFSRKHMVNFRPSLRLKNPEFRQLFKIATPAILASFLVELNFIVQQTFSVNFEDAIPALNQANQLFTLPMGIMTSGLVALVVANVSGFIEKNSYSEARDFLTQSMKMAMFLMMPFVILYLTNAFDVVQSVYQWNRESYMDIHVSQTAMLLCIKASVMLIVVVNNFLLQTFFAIRKTFITLVSNILTILINAFVCWLMVYQLNMGVESLAVASIIVNLADFALLFTLLKKYAPQIVPSNISSFFIKLIAAALAMGAFLIASNFLIPKMQSKLMQLLLFGGKAVLGAAVFIFAAYILRIEEVHRLAGRLKNFIFRKKGKERSNG